MRSAPVNAGLSGFVFVQLAALASVVFVASAAPLIMWQGDGTLVGQRTAANLLRWPVLPIVIALASTYVVATLVNRRFTETLIATRNEHARRVGRARGTGRLPALKGSIVPRLLIIAGDGSERELELTERTVQIGRGPGNDVVLSDPRAASRGRMRSCGSATAAA